MNPHGLGISHPDVVEVLGVVATSCSLEGKALKCIGRSLSLGIPDLTCLFQTAWLLSQSGPQTNFGNHVIY